jgi:membrane-associated PAP2 superfamily phosphatase
VLWLVFELAGLDRAASGVFYDAARQRFPLHDNWFLTRVAHDGLSWAMLLFWLACLVRGGAWRRGALLMACAVAVVLSLKSLSSVACPWDLPEFGGQVQSGRCLPAAHPVAGFGLFGLYLALREPRPRAARYTLVAALVIGLAAGAVQVARGAHFASHVLWTAWIAWVVTRALAAARRWHS